eukprot:COSAG01_NODE_29411_length_638_cov_0.946197_1_plen_23_part_10
MEEAGGVELGESEAVVLMRSKAV